MVDETTPYRRCYARSVYRLMRKRYPTSPPTIKNLMIEIGCWLAIAPQPQHERHLNMLSRCAASFKEGGNYCEE